MAFNTLYFVIGVLIRVHFINFSFQNSAICHPHVAGSTNVGIIGGYSIPIEWAPHMASIRFKDTHICGASIVSKQFVLSAAHCFMRLGSFEWKNIKIMVGTASTSGNGGNFSDTEKLFVHDKFNSTTFDYDVAIIKLKKPLTFGSTVRNIKLDVAGLVIKNGAKLNVTGWGSTVFNKTELPPTLQQVSVPVFDKKKCNKIFLHRIDFSPRMMCAGNCKHNFYKGDSGGPLTYNGVQVGIVSFNSIHKKQEPSVSTKQEDSRGPFTYNEEQVGFVFGNRMSLKLKASVYTKVSSVADWIMKNMH